jgi:hypothetical protein
MAGLDPWMKVYDEPKDLGAVLEGFGIAQKIMASPVVVERIVGELFEDANAQNIKLRKVCFSPDWGFSGRALNRDDTFEGLLQPKRQASDPLSGMSCANYPAQR